MEYNIDKKLRFLNADEIECRVGTINSKGCSLLLYKDARVDMKILDETYGVGNWQRTHEVINGNLFCTIEIWNDKINQWVKKQDVGTESYTEKEKGQASDSFKRAGFNVGIGRELYTSPFIWISPKADMKPYNTKDIDGNDANEFYPYKGEGYNKVYTTKTQFSVEEIDYDENGVINKLTIKDHKGNIRFQIDDTKDVNLTSEFNSKLIESGTDLEDIVKHFKKPYEKLTDDDKKEAIKIMNKKIEIKGEVK